MNLANTSASCLLGLLVASVQFGCARAESGKPGFHGRDLVVAGRYEEAISELNNYLDQHPQGQFASRTSLFLGKAYLGLGQMDEARRAFEQTIERYPATLEAHKSRYKLALLTMLTGEPAKARQQFLDMAEQPDGPLAPEATAMAAYLAGQL